jgi:FKBP-type peptidyl-prolyl cis-trans isomerase 2
MQTAQKGDYVTVDYDGMREDGEIFESSLDNGPLSFVIGQDTVFPSFEAAVIGMAPGETRTATVSSGESYGPRHEDWVQVIDRASLGEDIDPKPGMVLGMKVEREGESHQVPALIVEVTDSQVTVDYNHPLAGQDLKYKITLQSIAEPEGSAEPVAN